MNKGFWRGVLLFCILMLLMLVGSIPFVESGSATFVVMQLSAIHIFAAMAIISAMLYFDWDPFEPFRNL